MEVGLAASIITIIDASTKTVKYLQDVKDAPAARRKLAVEVTSLLSHLTDLQYRVEEAKATEPWLQGVRSLAVENGPLDQIRGVMEDLARKLRPVGQLKGSVRALVWALDRKETDDMLSKINRVNTRISIALQKDQFALSLKTDQRVVGVDRNILEIADGVSAIRLDRKEEAISGGRLQVANWMSPLDFYQTHNDALSKRQQGTGKWFLESKHFKQWVKGTSKTLWCPGMPGAGKTVIAAAVIEYLQRIYYGTNTGIAFVYCNYKKQAEQTSTNLVSSLLGQLAMQNPSILDNLVPIYKLYSSKKSRPMLSELSTALRSAISSFANVFIVIDALDECYEKNGSREDLLDSLRGLADHARFMFTSRPNVRIAKSFPHMQELKITANNQDIRAYLDARVSQTPRLVRIIASDLALADKVVDTITENVKGMFLLARLHTDSLAKKSSRNAVVKALDNLSGSLDEAYKEALQRIEAQDKDDRQLAMKAIYWITLSKVPLTVRELQHALAVNPGACRLDKGDLVDEETLLSVCAGLVTIEQKSNIIRLVHFTTQDYFESIQRDHYPTAQKEIATTCLTYLLFEDFASGPCSADKEFLSQLKDNALLDYSARYWGEHTRGEVEDIIEIMILELLQDNLRRSSCVQVARVPQYQYERFSQSFPREVSGLQVAAASGLNQTVCLLLEKGADIKAKDSHGGTALGWAAEGGHEAVVLLLLEKGADTEANDGYGGTALIWAAKGGHEAVVRLLLEKGADAEAKNSYGMTALIWAAKGGYEAMVRLLLEKGADTEAKNSDGMTALSKAAEEGHEAVVRLLLEKGADTEAKANNGWTALNGAARGGHEAVVRLLLEKGADTEVKGNTGITALIWAAWAGHEAVVRLLLEKWADIEAKEDKGMTALSNAAWEGHEAVVRLLLEKGADTRAKEDEGQTALDLAAYAGYEAVVRLLLEKGAEIEAKANNGWTALISAAYGGHEAVVRLLLEKGADIEAKAINGWTALMWAAEGGYEAVVRLLLEKGADTEAKNSDGMTALSKAAEGGHEAVVRLLLEKGADTEAKNSDGMTALSKAAEGGHEAVVQILRSVSQYGS